MNPRLNLTDYSNLMLSKQWLRVRREEIGSFLVLSSQKATSKHYVKHHFYSVNRSWAPQKRTARHQQKGLIQGHQARDKRIMLGKTVED